MSTGARSREVEPWPRPPIQAPVPGARSWNRFLEPDLRKVSHQARSRSGHGRVRRARLPLSAPTLHSGATCTFPLTIWTSASRPGRALRAWWSGQRRWCWTRCSARETCSSRSNAPWTATPVARRAGSSSRGLPTCSCWPASARPWQGASCTSTCGRLPGGSASEWAGPACGRSCSRPPFETGGM